MKAPLLPSRERSCQISGSCLYKKSIALVTITATQRRAPDLYHQPLHFLLINAARRAPQLQQLAKVSALHHSSIDSLQCLNFPQPHRSTCTFSKHHNGSSAAQRQVRRRLAPEEDDQRPAPKARDGTKDSGTCPYGRRQRELAPGR